MNQKLQDAVAVFKALGWEEAGPENVLQLPLGTREQKQTALAGLKSGDWGEFTQISENQYGWRSFIDVDKTLLALFAIRVGVDARRAVNISYGTDYEMLLDVLCERGANYASEFIKHACVSSRRPLEHSASVFGSVAVKLVYQLNLDIPQNVEYMKDWSAYAAAAMGKGVEVHYDEKNLPDLNMIRQRFTEHILVGIAVGSPATGPFGAVLPAGVECGWLSREKAVDLIFSALDMSVRPGDRKVWLKVLDQLEIQDQELYMRIEALIPLLSSGEAAVITRLAPVLIAQADESLLTEVLLAAFSGRTKAVKQLVLETALERPRPQGAETLAPWLADLAGDKDKKTESLARQLIRCWQISAEELSEDDGEILGLWQETPTLWQPERFCLEEVSADALTALAARLAVQPAVIHDVTTEYFLAMLAAVAYQNPEAARTSIRGLQPEGCLLPFVVSWINGEKPRYGFDEGEKGIKPPLDARDYAVCLHLGELPCLLSTPSLVDLSVCVSDLADRLLIYKKAGTDVLEADLFLALMRLDPETRTPEAVELLNKADISVVLQSGDKLPVTAGEAVLAYLKNPVRESSVRTHKYGRWRRADETSPAEGFPDRLWSYGREFFAVFPNWGDISLEGVSWSGEADHEQGLILRQVARRAVPLPPGAAINFLAAQRSMPADVAADSALALTEAWERGLLRPGIADAALLDWKDRTKPPSHLAMLASVLNDAAREGMLPVVWPVLDDLISASVNAVRLLAGTYGLAEVVLKFLPEVKFAVQQKMAPESALYLPGVRALAAKGGLSRAAKAARKIADQLPPVTDQPEEESFAAAPGLNFDEVWPADKKKVLPINDDVKVAVDWADLSLARPLFLFTLTLPGIDDRVFHVVNRGWFYDLEQEGQCHAQASLPGTTYVYKKEDEVWLHWDSERQAVAVCKNRNWFGGNDGPLRGVRQTPLPMSLQIVLIGLLAQDGDAVYYAPRLLRKFIETGEIGEEVIRKASQTFIVNPVVSPAKLVRVLEKDVKLLHVMWPVLTEYIKFAGTLAGEGKALPGWVNRILAVALQHALYLAEAGKRGLIPAEDACWPGLAEIAGLKSKSAAVGKAKKLMQELVV